MTRPAPFLSIVTISFNQAQYLRQCVDSVVSQKGSDVEYIVVDPGSTDGSREILQGYGDAIDHLVLEPDQGPADGLNKGFALATGEVGYFINSDDFMLPGAIDRMRRLWDENHGIDILLGGAWMVDGKGEPVRELGATAADLRSLLLGDAALVQQGMSFRLARFRDAGGFQLANRTCWDYELLCALLARGATPLVTKQRFGAFRIYENSLSGGAGGAQHVERYRADLNRIHCAFAGRPVTLRGRAASAFARARRLLLRPSMTLSRVKDRLFPKRMRNRYNADQIASGLRQG